MAQKFTSANTSINSTKLPSVYKKLGKIIKKFNIPTGGDMLDYGCGKFTDHLEEKADEIGFEWWGYDKFNQPEEWNEDASRYFGSYWFEVAVCSNVLNVIDDEGAVQAVVDEVVRSAKFSVFTIYEGDGSGIGRQTKADCYQRNEKLTKYWRFFEKYGAYVSVYNNCFIVDLGYFK